MLRSTPGCCPKAKSVNCSLTPLGVFRRSVLTNIVASHNPQAMVEHQARSPSGCWVSNIVTIRQQGPACPYKAWPNYPNRQEITDFGLLCPHFAGSISLGARKVLKILPKRALAVAVVFVLNTSVHVLRSGCRIGLSLPQLLD